MYMQGHMYMRSDMYMSRVMRVGAGSRRGVRVGRLQELWMNVWCSSASTRRTFIALIACVVGLEAMNVALGHMDVTWIDIHLLDHLRGGAGRG